jgi:hypothetical protein
MAARVKKSIERLAPPGPEILSEPPGGAAERDPRCRVIECFGFQPIGRRVQAELSRETDVSHCAAYWIVAVWTCPAFVESVFDFTLPAVRTEAG